MSVTVIISIVCGLAAIVLFVRGMIGTPVFEAPMCASCRYDVRAAALVGEQLCPECGSDITGPKAVRFGRNRRSRLVLLGALLLAGVPVALHVTPKIQARRAEAARTRLPIWTEQELVDGVHANITDFDVWREIGNRARRSTLGAHDIDAIVAELERNGRGLLVGSLGHEVFMALFEGGEATEAQLQRAAPLMVPDVVRVSLPRSVQQATPARYWMSPLAQRQTARTYYHVRSIRLDGAGEVEMLPSDRRFGRAMLRIDADPGSYDLHFELDVGLGPADPTRLTAAHREPTPPEQWPNDVVRWTDTVVVHVDLLSGDRPPPVLAERHDLLDQVRDAIKVHALRVLPRSGFSSAKIDYEPVRQMPMHVRFRVIVQCDGREYDFGHFSAGPYDGWGASGRRASEQFPPSATSVTVIFRPDVELVDEHSDIEKIFGLELIYEDVPVVREDVASPLTIS